MMPHPDFSAFIPFVNRPDLVARVQKAFLKAGIMPSLIDNSGPLPLTFSQSMNYEFETALQKNRKFILHAHSDADIPDGSITALIDFARAQYDNDVRWSVIYTHYDVLCAYNIACYQSIGGYDTNIRAYKSDQDWYHRCDLSNWKRINTDIPCNHGVEGEGSQTINSDPRLKYLNGYIQQLDSLYYASKWGGDAGQEIYSVPFNRPDLFGGPK